jgi:ABC-2 type transport system ATP-binding protein
MTTVSVSSVRKNFGSVTAVQDVSFDVYPGEIFGLLGPNGAGKTTTIRMMLDIFKPDEGSISIFGGDMDEEKKQRIGYMPEERGLYKDQKLDQTLIFLAQLKGMDKTTAQKELDVWLKRLDLDEHRHKKVKELSKGMQQKAQLIATLLHDPDLVVIDEPFSGLDPVNTRLVKEIIDDLRQANKSIIMSTHMMYQVEALCNRIVLINNGRSVIYGEVGKIKRSFAGNAIELKGQGNFAEMPGVLEARQVNGNWHLALAPGENPQEIFRQLAAAPNTTIDRFEIAEPSLDDIFVTVVKEGVPENLKQQSNLPNG